MADKDLTEELKENDRAINPHTGQPHGEPATPREKKRRESFVKSVDPAQKTTSTPSTPRTTPSGNNES